VRYTPGGLAAAAPEAGAVPMGAGEARLWVLRDGSPVSVAVVLGLDDDAYTEILKGDIKPGDLVIVAEQRNSGGQSGLPMPRF